MAAAAHFDTLDYARKLEAAGVPKVQAELQAQALNDAFSDRVASHEDLARLEAKMDARFISADTKMDAGFAAVNAKIDGKIDSLRHELGGKIETLKWMFGVLVAFNAAMFVQLLLKH